LASCSGIFQSESYKSNSANRTEVVSRRTYFSLFVSAPIIANAYHRLRCALFPPIHQAGGRPHQHASSRSRNNIGAFGETIRDAGGLAMRRPV